MRRFKSLDVIRGICIVIMVYGHPFEWWLISDDQWLFHAYYAILGNIAGMGFIFVSGLSTILFYRSRLHKAETSDNYSLKRVKKEYFIRALIILLIAFIFNISTAFFSSNIFNIWKWFIMMTIGFSLLIAYPLLNTSIYTRFIIAITAWIINQFLLAYLLPFEGQVSLNGILFHLFYNSLDLHPILYYFGFFIVGTALGDILFKIFSIEKNSNDKLKLKFTRNLLSMGMIFVIFGVIFRFPEFLVHDTISSLIYSNGIILVLLALFLFFEDLRPIKLKKSYKILFYYSYYSLTIYLLHFLLYYLFFDSLNAITIWFATFGVGLILTTLLRLIYKKFGRVFSLKIQIGRISSGLAEILEERKTLK